MPLFFVCILLNRPNAEVEIICYHYHNFFNDKLKTNLYRPVWPKILDNKTGWGSLLLNTSEYNGRNPVKDISNWVQSQTIKGH